MPTESNAGAKAVTREQGTDPIEVVTRALPVKGGHGSGAERFAIGPRALMRENRAPQRAHLGLGRGAAPSTRGWNTPLHTLCGQRWWRAHSRGRAGTAAVRHKYSSLPGETWAEGRPAWRNRRKCWWRTASWCAGPGTSCHRCPLLTDLEQKEKMAKHPVFRAESIQVVVAVADWLNGHCGGDEGLLFLIGHAA
jgi:hypothetical protein